MRWLVAVAALAGCDRLFGAAPVRVTDGMLEAARDTTVFLDAPACIGSSSLFRFCPGAAVTTSHTYTGMTTIDTDTDTSCEVSYAPACLILFFDVTIDGTLQAIGGRPLVLAAAHDLQVLPTRVVDVSSHRALPTVVIGAAANLAAGCPLATPYAQMGATTDFAAGGPGGSFGGPGGDGGIGGSGSSISPGPIAGPLALLRGGCKGSPGGASGSGTATAGGNSGGAVALVAGHALRIQGVVLANGAGSPGGPNGGPGECAGGGGGGSGGLVVIDAPAITVDFGAVVQASGGGGGAGTNENNVGNLGSDPDPTKPTSAAPAGILDIAGGDGSSQAPARSGAAGAACGNLGGGGGGGGGGGAGIVKLFGDAAPTINGAAIVPAPS